MDYLQAELEPGPGASTGTLAHIHEMTLGSGAPGDVTVRKEDGKWLALKTTSQQLLKLRQFEAAAEAERDAFEICQGHPCIARLYGHMESAASTVLVMEVLQDLVGVYTSAALRLWLANTRRAWRRRSPTCTPSRSRIEI